MLPRASRRGATAGQPHERKRTHMLFRASADRGPVKRRRRTHNKLQQHSAKKVDEMVQTQELDPTQWTGNQRVLHFGPMAQRDPYYYYYPKGWDVLYPAHFGFFPYRTNKFRGSTGMICIWSFGLFLLLGGVIMTSMAYFLPTAVNSNNNNIDDGKKVENTPAHIAGPILIAVGLLLVLIGIVYSLATSQMLNEKLRHHYHRDQAPTVTVYTTHWATPSRVLYEAYPYQRLPPPASNIIANPNAHTDLVNPSAEMKLFPPMIHGQSTLSLHSAHQQQQQFGGIAGGVNTVFLASPYNTLGAMAKRSAGTGSQGPAPAKRGGGRRKSSAASFGQYSRGRTPSMGGASEFSVAGSGSGMGGVRRPKSGASRAESAAARSAFDISSSDE